MNQAAKINSRKNLGPWAEFDTKTKIYPDLLKLFNQLNIVSNSTKKDYRATIIVPLGNKIEKCLLKTATIYNYISDQDKLNGLVDLLQDLNLIKTELVVIVDMKLIDLTHLAGLINIAEPLCRQVAGWINSLQQKINQQHP